MKWTNNHNIDPAIAQAVMEDDYEAVGDISVTRLVRPPQITALEHQHGDDLVQDITDGLYSLEGRALHNVLGAARADGRLQEKRLMTECNGWTVSGRFDVYYETGAILKDYKVASVWSYILGGKEDWEMQLNFYAYLAAENGLMVDELKVVMWFRDWQKSKARREKDYPPIKVIEHRLPQWSLPECGRVFEERVRLHQAARNGDYPPCSPEERWAKPDTWAVQKPDAKKAYRVFEEPALAKTMADSMPGYEVQHRPGENSRCVAYCSVMPFCQQAKDLGVVQEGE